MDQNFQKLKRKYLYIAIIKSVLAGLAACALTVGVLLLTLKLTGVKINAGYYVLVGAVAFAAAGGLTFLFTRPTDKSVAKKLDGDHGLNEKIQTMVEFRGEEGTILSLQREDAESVLGGVSVKRPSLKRILVCAAVAVVSLAMFISAICVPSRYAQGEIIDEYEITRLQAVALQQLIDDVNKSDLKENSKDSTVLVLENLLEGLQNTLQDSVMRKAVVSSITIIDGILADANSYLKISSDLRKSDNEHLKSLATAIYSGGVFYRNLSVKPDSLSKINEIAFTADDVLAESITNSLSGLRGGYNELSGTPLAVELVKFSQECNGALGENINADDGLYRALTAFNSELSEIAKRISGGGYTQQVLQEQIDSAFNKLAQDGGAALADQSYNCMMDEFIRNRLAEIFKISAPELPSNENVAPAPTPDDGSGDDPDGTHTGGGGHQDVIYGSNDLVYSPEDDSLVKYGTVINSYYAAVLERIANGEMSEEAADNINKYFEILFSGIQEEAEN